MIPFLAMFASAVLAAPADTTDFRQGVDYRIEATLNESTDVLHGRARLRYTNRAPVALDTLFFHQHLNAFRPNSAWARRELEYGERRFQDLGPEEHAFERFTAVQVGGTTVRPVYPGAPDSTVVALPLPAPLAPGESIELRMDWNARLSTLPRRQGRKGRQYDFAQWYPRIAVYDQGGWETQPLLPQGEFFGEFGAYDVTLDVAADQVLGSTGVPVEGDPGWRTPGGAEPLYRRDAYPARSAESLGLLSDAPAAARKRVRWRAEDVHHFAWSADPTFRYEGGTVERAGGPPVAIHVLYQPADTAWDEGVVLGRTRKALAWLESMFGPYPWPQLTNLHRIERGGTEFPMLVMDGSESEGLIAHEVAHQFVHGALANNEWRDGWLDEGFASFVDTWYFEDQGQTGLWDRSLETMREMERAGQTQPIATPGAEFRDPRTYSAMTYTKTSLVLRMLRDLVGEDAMRQILRTYYRENALSHVTEADFRAVAERVSGRDLGWFFRQWFHTTDTLDYAVGNVGTERLPNGRWRTRVEVLRLGKAQMPVRLQIGDATQTLDLGDRRSAVIEIVTTSRPAEVVLDPDNVLLDLDPTNNRRVLNATVTGAG